jgi:hypothetical protein
MKSEKIRSLLAKYYKGETTLDEEQDLRKYFLDNPDVPEEFIVEKEQFIMYDKAAKKEVPFDDFEEKLEKLIDDQKVIRPDFTSRKLWIRVAGVAASILLVFSVYNSFKYFISKPDDTGTFDDPVIAYEETKKALYFVSSKFNEGTKNLANISKLEEGQKMLRPVSKLDQGLNKLQLLSKIKASQNDE